MIFFLHLKCSLEFFLCFMLKCCRITLSRTPAVLISIPTLLIKTVFLWMFVSISSVFYYGWCFCFCNSEVLAPQRPPAPPTEYFEFNLGGYDPDNLIAVNNLTQLQGYVGCMRGLKIGDHLFDLSLQVTNSSKAKEGKFFCPLWTVTWHSSLWHEDQAGKYFVLRVMY